jgi:hypothetical protein
MTLLGQLVNEQLSAVVFVQDYLQLDFDGKRLTVNVWPTVTIEDHKYSVGANGYRDALCGLIGKTVSTASETEVEITLTFLEGQIIISVIDEIPIEHVIFEDTTTKAWAWW